MSTPTPTTLFSVTSSKGPTALSPLQQIFWVRNTHGGIGVNHVRKF
jgi:hypothetical protein